MATELTLSVLDQSPMREGGTAAQALRETIELARRAEQLGFRRYWVAEHHNTGGYAGTAPEILIGQIAANTDTIRVGSGGVMLSHYSALKVAESFRLLSALYPGRIDLGIGRAPGSDQRTAAALVAPRPQADLNAFPQQVADLVGFLSGTLPAGHPFAQIEAQAGPPPDDIPEVWLLGSSDYSARLAAAYGLPFAFADFFGAAGDHGPQIAEIYRRQYQPSDGFPEPKLSVAVHVICAETAERAHFIAASRRLGVVRMRSGIRSHGLVAPDIANDYEARAGYGELAKAFSKHDIEGDPDQVREGLLAAAARYGTTDLIIATNCYSFEDRASSFRLVAERMNGER